MSENGSLAQQQHQRVREALRRITEPLETEMRKIDARLEELEEETKELRAARREALAVLRVVDPEHSKKPGPKRSEMQRASQESIEKVLAYIREHKAELADGFSGRMITRGSGLGISPDTVRRSLETLAEQGLLRLDRVDYVGGQTAGTRPRVFKLVEDR